MIKEINNQKEIEDIFYKLFNTKLLINIYSKIIVYEEEKIMGFMIYDLIYDRCEIEYIGVLEEYRNKKIATRLLEYLNNYELSNITLEVNINNLPAIKLYEKNGFKIASKRKKYYNKDDAYLMIKEV